MFEVKPSRSASQDKSTTQTQSNFSPPAISLPKGGGAIRGIGEKFAANPVTGTGSIAVPIAASVGRSGFSPQLNLAYDSGSGNGPFGFGWSLSLPSITRKTDKGLPQYRDAEESDAFIISGAEDLVPSIKQNENDEWVPDEFKQDDYNIKRYRPRIEGLFARIERWTHTLTGVIHWRSISKDNITTLYGTANNSCIFDPNETDWQRPTRIFSWLISASYDDKGNAIVYEYEGENENNIDRGQANECNRVRTANRYLKRIKYGNRVPNRDLDTWQASDAAQLPTSTWMFEVVFDYGNEHYVENAPDSDRRTFVQAQSKPLPGSDWPVRQDPFSSYRAGFEVRTYRLCHRVLMFHHFPQELAIDDCLVRSTEFSYAESPVASFITSVTQSGYVRQPRQDMLNRYLKKSLPPLEFEYSQIPSPEQLAQKPIWDVDPKSFENLPLGLDGIRYQWMDLDGEGISGILTEQADGWYYKRNMSANNQVSDDGKDRTVARFGPTEVVAKKPINGLTDGAQFLDLAGDGQVDLVQMQESLRGFYERTDDSSWESFQPFLSWPEINPRDPDLRFVDLTGDGHADILITGDDVLTWYPSLAEEGFGAAERVSVLWDEEKGPRMVFADGTESIYLADFSGDGLTDLVRVRNGEICYWPNLGYGHFGTKVTMDNSPRFDSPDQFDQKRIRLVDTDGSGTTDILYLRRDGVQIYFNQSGNSWSAAVALLQLPSIDNIASVQALDLLGNGTACLVWSSPLVSDTQRPMRYLALMDEKPHLLVGMKNNLGAETRIQYAASTKFYLNDKQAGQPWITRLPFPVHVVERVESLDWISHNRFATRYAYHHGYFDGPEREFRGFGMVEQWDTEEIGTWTEDINWDAASLVTPVLTRTWFHNGAYIKGERISKQFEHEYYHEGNANRGESRLTDSQLEAMLLADTELPITIFRADGTRVPYTLSGDEAREACRSLKGSILRQEIYALDKHANGAPAEESERPYVVSERNYTIEWLQPQNKHNYAVFFTHAREAVEYHYERKLYDIGGDQRADPRVTHTLTLQVDDYGNILRSVVIGYERRFPDQALTVDDQTKQMTPLVTCTINAYTKPVSEAEVYRAPLLCESRTYEILNLAHDSLQTQPNITNLFRFDQVSKQIEQASDGNHDLPYEDVNHALAVTNDPYRRLIEHARTLYRKNDLTGFSPLGEVESLALPGETLRLGFTANFLQTIFVDSGKLSASDAHDILTREGGYVHSEGDANWWISSGRIFYSPTPNDPSASELIFARAHFFLPHRYRDPFHTNLLSTESTITYDQYNLLVVETRDPLGNLLTVKTPDDDGNTAVRNDYRVLQPYWVTDPNRNRTQVVFDALGMVVATAAMGKAGESKGDLINSSFEPDLYLGQIQDLVRDPRGQAPGLLKGATTRFLYDLDRFRRAHQPPFAATLAREIHFHDAAGTTSPVQISFIYSDGFGREIQTKVQAEPGDAAERGNDVTLASGDIQPGPLVYQNNRPKQTLTSRRWVGAGRTVYNNKGKPVKKYEPFFSSTHLNESEPEMTDTGVTSILFYDPVDRVVTTLHPDHTYEKVVFDPWTQISFDANDTIAPHEEETGDPRTDPSIKDLVTAYFSTQPASWQTWYAQRQAGALGALEQVAATQSALHANTPTVDYFDTLGRTFLTTSHNRFEKNSTAVDERYTTHIELDIEGNTRVVRDAQDRVVMRYDYDILGNRIQQASMESGKRWVLNDVLGKPIRVWDSRNFKQRITYDVLRRPRDLFVTENHVERLTERTVYGENQGDTDNHRMRIYQIFDSAGIMTNEVYDFKGNVQQSKRELLPNYQQALDWLDNPIANDGTFTSRTEYDALNRPVAMTMPDMTSVQPIYNEANLLEKLSVSLHGVTPAELFVTNIDYNAKGQRELIEYGNGVSTSYQYDAETYRLIHLKTTRPGDINGLASQLFANATIVQDSHYTYDPVGNITNITDAAISTIQYNNENVESKANYVYDAIYRLIEAQSREHIGQTAFEFNPPNGSYRDYPFVGLRVNPNDPKAVRNYREGYEYDEVGNIKVVRHSATNGSWTRTYVYEEPSLLNTGVKNNRLTRTRIGDSENFIESYGYRDEQGNDVDGCMTSINSIKMTWDFKAQLQKVDLGGGGTAYYVYDATGQRVRKVTHNLNGAKQKERIYLGGFEIYREYNTAGGSVELEREALHIMDDKQRIALIETRTQGNDPAPQQVTRYQLGNHLASSSLELDEQAQIISYEEYSPYGSSSYQVARSQTETPKRYRYTGKERDEESGLYYHGARYYAPWLGRWTSCDPAGMTGAISLFAYVGNNPAKLIDPDGALPKLPTLQEISDQARHGLERASELAHQGAQEAKQFVDKGIEIAKPVAQGLVKAQAQMNTENVETVVQMMDPSAPVKGVAQRVKNAFAAPTKFVERKLAGDTTTDALGQAAEAGLKTLPFQQPAEDLDKAIKAGQRGDTSSAVQHGVVGGQHFIKEVVETALALEGAANPPTPPKYPGGGSGNALPPTSRAIEIHNAAKGAPKFRDLNPTTVLKTAEGPSLVSRGPTKGLTPSQKGILRPDERAVRMRPDTNVPKSIRIHPDVRPLVRAHFEGLTPVELEVAGQPFCSFCRETIEAFGGQIVNPYKAIFPRK